MIRLVSQSLSAREQGPVFTAHDVHPQQQSLFPTSSTDQSAHDGGRPGACETTRNQNTHTYTASSPPPHATCLSQSAQSTEGQTFVSVPVSTPVCALYGPFSAGSESSGPAAVSPTHASLTRSIVTVTNSSGLATCSFSLMGPPSPALQRRVSPGPRLTPPPERGALAR